MEKYSKLLSDDYPDWSSKQVDDFYQVFAPNIYAATHSLEALFCLNIILPLLCLVFTLMVLYEKEGHALERGVLDPNQLHVQFLLNDKGDIVKEFDDNDGTTAALESQVINK